MRPTIAVPLLVVLSVVYRLPALAHATATNSDAAIVGLQALHLLRGEHSAFLWGSSYQTAADAYVAAAFFWSFAATPLVLMVSTLAGHVALTLFGWGILRRHGSEAAAFALALLFVLTTSPVTSMTASVKTNCVSLTTNV